MIPSRSEIFKCVECSVLTGCIPLVLLVLLQEATCVSWEGGGLSTRQEAWSPRATLLEPLALRNALSCAGRYVHIVEALVDSHVH